MNEQKLRQIMGDYKVSLQEIADYLGCSKNSVIAWLRPVGNAARREVPTMAILALEAKYCPKPSTGQIVAASVVVHLIEYGSPDGQPIDLQAAQSLLGNADLRGWLKSFNKALLPNMRKSKL